MNNVKQKATYDDAIAVLKADLKPYKDGTIKAKSEREEGFVEGIKGAINTLTRNKNIIDIISQQK